MSAGTARFWTLTIRCGTYRHALGAPQRFHGPFRPVTALNGMDKESLATWAACYVSLYTLCTRFIIRMHEYILTRFRK